MADLVRQIACSVLNSNTRTLSQASLAMVVNLKRSAYFWPQAGQNGEFSGWPQLWQSAAAKWASSSASSSVVVWVMVGRLGERMVRRRSDGAGNRRCE